jgi:transmembrane sensor
MTEPSDPRRAEAAIDWLIRQRDPAFADWAAFTAWIEADSRNADIYAELAARDEALARRLGERPAAEPELEAAPGPRRPLPRRWFMAGALAAAASLVLVLSTRSGDPEPALYRVATAPGVQQIVRLADGSTVVLNGASRVVLDRNNARFAELEQGEASFAVVHDDSNPFRVRVAGDELIDLGTRFNVLREDGMTEVAVAEGLVMYNPEAEAIRLAPGRALRVSKDRRSVAVSMVAPAAVGAWQQGRLVYDNAPLAQVARDLSRSIGTRVTADPAVAARPVTAVVQLPKDRKQLAPRLERLLDITVSQSDEGWILTTRG